MRVRVSAADVVVRDRLAPVVELPDGVEVVETGKQAHGPSWSQADIEALMVERARAGRHVVRLKGGDVHLFARGIEEVAACVTAGRPAIHRYRLIWRSVLSNPAADSVPASQEPVFPDHEPSSR